jgi:hypothetical protein
MDYMQSAGLDPSIVKEYWDAATDGANTYISSLQEILSLTDRFQNKLKDIKGIEDRLAAGTATYDDMMAMVNAGVDISNF